MLAAILKMFSAAGRKRSSPPVLPTWQLSWFSMGLLFTCIYIIIPVSLKSRKKCRLFFMA
jgi:hypothetical protein